MSTAPSRAWRWLAARPLGTCLVVVAVLTAAAGWRDVARGRELTDFVGCVARWGDRTSERAARITAARSELDTAQDALWRAFSQGLTHPGSVTPERFSGLLDIYVRASDGYRANLVSNPVPPAPALACGTNGGSSG
jgi:hypothetical protein